MLKISIPYWSIIALLDPHIRKILEFLGQETFPSVSGYLASTHWYSVPERFVSGRCSFHSAGLTTCDWCATLPYIPLRILSIFLLSVHTAVSFIIAPNSKQPPNPPTMTWIFCGAVMQQNNARW